MNPFETLLKPIRRRINALALRAVVTLAGDAVEELLQVEASDGDVRDNVPRVQDYGLASKPGKGSQAIVLGLGGNRSSSVAIVVAPPGERPELKGDEVALWSLHGQYLKLDEDGNVVVFADLLKGVKDIADALGTLDELRQWAAPHVHTSASPGSPTSPPTTPPPGTAGE